ncbi:MAG TPA: transporter [Telmatospirillum sp.]|nr:transporter [Telmatospirillum sp.]
MKTNVTCCAMALAGIAFCSLPAGAEELWDPQLRGVNEGTVAGALPPPGVYGVLDNYFLSYQQYDNKGNQTGLKVDALIEVPVLLWSTGIKVLGADYAVAISQPFDYTNVKQANVPALSNNAHWGTYNTILVPGQLAWALANDFHVKTGLTVYVDDASSSPAHPPAGHGVGSGNSYWTLQPDFAVSWLRGGWNLSVDAHYDYNFEDGKTHYTSGQEISIDYTASKTIGNWTFGIGVYQQNQLNKDSGLGALAKGCPASGGCMVENYGAGPLIGYQFGDINIMAEYNHNIYTRNELAGDFLNIRLMKAF